MNKILLSFITLFLLVSCDNFIIEEPETHMNNQNSWQTEQDVATAVYGLHQIFRNNFGSADIFYRDRGMPFDEVASTWTKSSQNDLSGWGPNSGNLVWGDYYRIIANCHLVLENLYRANLPLDRQNFYETQAQFLLCYTYYYLICNWGDVPYIDKGEDIEPHARMPWVEVADHLREILYHVIEIAPSVDKLFDEKRNPIISKQFACKESAKALLAQIDCRTALLGNRPELNKEGIRLITEIIDSGLYGLLDNYQQVRDLGLLGNSIEGVFELDFEDTPDDIHQIGRTMCMMAQKWPLMPNTTPATKRTIARLSYKAFNLLYNDPNDERRNVITYKPDETINYPQNINQGAVYFQKWPHFKTYQEGTNKGKVRGYVGNLIIIRLSKLYLQRAVMEYRTDNLESAKRDLNIIRQRSNVKNYSESEGDLLIAIVNEQIREHLGEGINERFNTIIENGLYKEMLPGKFKTLTDDDVRKGALFIPVALGAFIHNPFMRQNEYWKMILGR